MLDYAKKFNLDIKIGQMLMFGFKGINITDEWIKKIHNQISELHLGALLFVGYNIQDPMQTKLLTKYFKSASVEFPLLLAIDQEGGMVQRLNAKKGFEDYPSAEEVANKYSHDEAKELYNKMIINCKNYGFNFILAPVADLNINTESPVIGAVHRCFSSDPDIVTNYSGVFLEAASDNEVLSCLKHFPGHGSSRDDSHKDITDVTKTWKDAELIPYKNLIEVGFAKCIMSAHIFNSKIDPDYPASLSEKHLLKTLRKKLNFKGMIISDDMQMGAIHKHYSLEETVIKSIQAGNDMIMFSQFFNPEDDLPVKVVNIIKSAIEQNIISEKRINESFNRIMNLKKNIK